MAKAKRKVTISRFVMALGAGCGIGVAVPTVLQKYVEPMYGPYIPYLAALGNWGRWSVFVPLVSGVIGIGLSQFTNRIKNANVNGLVTTYSFTAIALGLVNGIFAPAVPPAARFPIAPARQAALIAQAAARPVARGATPTHITPTVILA